MVDSGAFSAWKLKKPVDLNKYCDFLDGNLDWIDRYVNLDVIIPGNPEEAAKAGFDNLVTMRSRGLNPIPVYHVREDIKWLKKMLDLGCEYIGLSATSLDAKGSIDAWYELAWKELVDNAGHATIMVHAFGDGREQALHKFPWKSADSSTWLNGQIYGNIYLPNGQRASHRSYASTSKSSPDISFFEDLDEEAFSAILENYGLRKEAFDERKSRQSWLGRSYLSAAYFVEMGKRVNQALPISFLAQGGLISQFEAQHTRTAIQFEEFDFFMAVGTNNSTIPGLHAAGCSNFLASYFYINDRLGRQLRGYYKDPEAIVNAPPYDKYMAIYKEILVDRNRPL